MKKDNCKYFNGTACTTCDAGVNYRELVGGNEWGWAVRLPCLASFRKRTTTQTVTCDKYQEPTDEEIAKEKAAFEASCERMIKVGPLVRRIKQENKGKSATGSDACPACNSGKIRWSIAGSNGHVHMVCSTKNCIAFME